MSDLVLADKDMSAMLADALAKYKEVTEAATGKGVTLAPGDPRRLHLQTFLLLLAQLRALIDFAGKQSLLRFVSEEFIDELAALWGESRLPPLPSKCTERFHFSSTAAHTVAAGVRVSDGTNLWRVTEDTTATDDHVDAPVECTENGVATNGIAEGQIDTLVDPSLVPGCSSVENITETISGRDVEGLEDFRARLRDVPEARSTCGPRTAYQAAALEASASVADAVALGPDDAGEMAGYPPSPGDVVVVLIQGARDDAGALESVVPDPDDGLLDTVLEALSAEDVRPLTDNVSTKAAEFVDFDNHVTIYIGRSRSKQASQILLAAEEAHAEWLLWQQSKIGRDINPDELTKRLLAVGVKRVVIADPAFQVLLRDQSARCSYSQLIYAGVEDD